MKEDDYIAKIRLYNTHKQLLVLLNNRDKQCARQFWQPGKLLEYVILRAFELEGYAVQWPFSIKAAYSISNNSVEQIDGVVYSDFIHFMIECKDYSTNINIEPIAKLEAQLKRRPPMTLGSVFVMTDYTTEALYLFRITNYNNILLWHKDEIFYCLKNKCFTSFLKRKYQNAVERADFCTNFVVEEEIKSKLYGKNK